MHLALGLVLMILATISLVVGTAALISWISRNASTWRRHLLILLRQQLRTLSTRRTWSAIALFALATAALVSALQSSLEILWISLALGGYVLFVCALTLAFLARMPVFQALWGSTFIKITLLAIPVLLLFISKGYAAVWIGELLKVSPVNVPLAHFAATAFLLLLIVGCALLFTALAFQLLFMAASCIHPHPGRPAGQSRSILALLFSLTHSSDPLERVRLRLLARGAGRQILLITTAVCCMAGFHAATTFASSRFGGVALSAIAFEFDAAPADQCELSKDEQRAVIRNEPNIKALYLSSSQEKALLVSRGRHLFDPLSLKSLKAEPEGLRRLEQVRVAKCFESKEQ